MKCSLGISNFLEEISSLSHSVLFLYVFALIAEEGFLISPCYSLELCIQMAISFLFLLCFSLLFFSQLFLRPPQKAILLFCISFPWGWSWSLSAVQCHEPLSIVHQVLCLSDLKKQKERHIPGTQEFRVWWEREASKLSINLYHIAIASIHIQTNCCRSQRKWLLHHKDK